MVDTHRRRRTLLLGLLGGSVGFLIVVLLWRGAMPWHVAGGAQHVPRKRSYHGLNLVVFLSDTLRAASLPFYGYPRNNAPRLSALAAESILLENHHANFPGTPISVSQMLTGRLFPPLLMGSGYSTAPVRAVTGDVFVLPKELRRRGFMTGLVSTHPWFDNTGRVMEDFDFTRVISPPHGRAYAPFESMIAPIEAFLDQAVRSGKPFFLYVHSMDTHGPNRMHPEQPSYEPDVPGYSQALAAYDSEILHTDTWVGGVIDSLQRRGELERTVVAFTSDHGEDHGEVGPETWNHGHGYTVRPSQLHVPLIIRLPGRDVRRGVRHSELTRHLDLGVTLYHLVDPTAPRLTHRVDGVDLSHLLRHGDPGGRLMPKESPAFSWRYWSMRRAGDDLVYEYDQWLDKTTRVRYERDAWNYPRPAPVAESDGMDPALQPVQEALSRFAASEPESEQLVGFPVGVPTLVLHGHGSAPTYAEDPADGRWSLNCWRRLEAGPQETVPPIALSTPWAPGRYHLRVRVDLRRTGFAHEFVLQLPGSDAEPKRLSGRMADRRGFIDAGVFDVGEMLDVQLSEAKGGVSVLGLVVTRKGAQEGTPTVSNDLESQLRALGYVE